MARQRLKWMDYYEARGRNAALTCRYFGISRQTLRYAQGQAVLPLETSLRPPPAEHSGGALPPSQTPEATYVVSGARAGGVAPAGGVSQMGERQTGDIAAEKGMADVDLHGGSSGEQFEEAGSPAGASAHRCLCTEAGVAAPLWYPKA